MENKVHEVVRLFLSPANNRLDYHAGAKTICAICDTSTGAFTVTMPDLQLAQDQTFVFYNIPSDNGTGNELTILGTRIVYDGVTTLIINKDESATLVSNLKDAWITQESASVSAGLELGETSTTAYRGDRGLTAYTHSQSTHAPANAQKNSDIIKSEIEAVLTGAITTHTHAYEPVHECSRMVLIESDLHNVNASSACQGLLGAALSSGTAAAATGDANHPGVITMSDSTTANGGYRFMTDTSAFLIAGGEEYNFIIYSNGVRSGQSFRLGFMDSTAIQTQPTDGVWFQSTSNGSTTTLLGRCKNNAGPSDTGTAYTLTANTWYRCRCVINSNATLVTFTIYNNTGQVWQQTVSSNIPTAAGRETGFGIICGETSTDAAAVIVGWDYVKLEIVRSINRCG
jgi:hypothetical protein